MKRIFLTAAVIAACISASAQMGSGSGYLKAADKYFQKGDYFSAATYYEKYLGLAGKVRQQQFDPYFIKSLSAAINSGSPDKQQAIYNLAESYRNLNYPVKAAPVYEQVIAHDRSRYPLSPYHYAVMLRALGQYSQAEKSFQSFLDNYGKQDAYSEAAKKELQNLRFIQEQLKRTDLSQYTITRVEAGNDGANYAPVWMNGNNLLFTSTRKENGDSKRLNKVYQAQLADKSLTAVQSFTVGTEKEAHLGVPALSPDGNTLYLTRWTIENGKRQSALYLSRKKGEQWTDPVRIGEEINIPGHNSQQPFVMPDGRQLIYATDRPGGQGGFDLWIAAIDEAGKPSNPQNMGTVINTNGDEQAPYYHTTSGSLVFASNGRIGMGGFDLYRSKGSAGSWRAPENLGHPINSVKDDIYFASQGGAGNMLEKVLLSSDRSSDCCLDLFYLTRNMPDRTIEGRILGCDGNAPLAGAAVKLVEQGTGRTISTATTDASGKYSVTLPEFKPMQAIATLDGYKESSIVVGQPSDAEDLVLYNQSICLESVPPPVNVAIVIPNIYYAFNKTQLAPESFESLDSLVVLMQKYPTMTVEIGAHTDNIGSQRQNQLVSDKRAANVVNYLASKGIERNRLAAKGYGYSLPLEPNRNADGSDNPAGREKNRRTEMKVLHY